MTVETLLDAVTYRYNMPVSAATVASFMNDAQRELGDFFEVEVTDTTVTVADTDEYALPAGCEDISKILELGISKQATPDDRYDYTRYSKATRDDYPRSGKGYYQVSDEDGGKHLVIYPIPTESDLIISVKYMRPLTDLDSSTTTQIPEFDSRYHMLLVYYAIRELASAGDVPDTLVADYWGRRWEAGLRELRRAKMQEKAKHPLRRRDNAFWHSGKEYVEGGTVTGGGEV